MQDELMKAFLEQVIYNVEGIADALNLILQDYHVRLAEREIENLYKEKQIIQKKKNH